MFRKRTFGQKRPFFLDENKDVRYFLTKDDLELIPTKVVKRGFFGSDIFKNNKNIITNDIPSTEFESIRAMDGSLRFYKLKVGEKQCHAIIQVYEHFNE